MHQFERISGLQQSSAVHTFVLDYLNQKRSHWSRPHIMVSKATTLAKWSGARAA